MELMLVAAIKPHYPLSWEYTHTAEGTKRLALTTVDKHNGAQVIPGLLLLSVTPRFVRVVNWQNVFGTTPK